jgi:hypothetical protein
VGIHPLRFDKELEREFLKAVSEAYFLFGDDVNSYRDKLRQDIVVVHTFETLGPARMKDDAANRSEATGRIHKFYKTGRPLFAKYMRFSQPVPLISQIATRFRSSLVISRRGRDGESEGRSDDLPTPAKSHEGLAAIGLRKYRRFS